jgi:DNA modification methylase
MAQAIEIAAEQTSKQNPSDPLSQMLDRVFNEDCLEGMKRIPDGSVDMILCDLPFGTTKCGWDSVIPFDRLWEQYRRVIKNDGAIVLFGAEPFSSHLRLSAPDLYRYDWIWDKVSVVGFANAKKMPLKNTETISVFYKKAPTYNPQGLIRTNPKTRKNGDTHTSRHDEKGVSALNGGRFKDSYISEFTNYPKQILRFARERGIHPTQKPVALCNYLVRTYTNPGDVVLDNCMGSGTTAVACLLSDRHFIGFEMSEAFFWAASERLEAARG